MIAVPSASSTKKSSSEERKNSLVDIASVIVASNRFHHHDERHHPGMVAEVARWWKAAVPEFDTGHVGEVEAEISGDKTHTAGGFDGTLQRHEYEVFYSRLVYSFNNDDDEDNNMDAEQILAALETDWKNDSRDDGTVDEIDFEDSIYELADCWVQDADGDGDIDADDMVIYLQELYERVFGVDKEEVAQWWEEHVMGPARKAAMKVSIRKSMKRLQKHSRIVGKLAHWGGLKKAMKITGHWHKMRTTLLRKIIMTHRIALFAGAAGARASQRRDNVKKKWVLAAAKAHGLQKFITLAEEQRSAAPEKYHNPEEAHALGGGASTNGYQPTWYQKKTTDGTRVYNEVILEDKQVLGVDFADSGELGTPTVAAAIQPNSEAAKAGIKAGDALVMVKGNEDEYYEEVVSTMNKNDVEQLISSKSFPKTLRFVEKDKLSVQVINGPEPERTSRGSPKKSPSKGAPLANGSSKTKTSEGSGHFGDIDMDVRPSAQQMGRKGKLKKADTKAWRSPYSLYVLGLPQESPSSNQLMQSSSGNVSASSSKQNREHVSPKPNGSKAYYQFTFDESLSSPDFRTSSCGPSWKQQSGAQRPLSPKKMALQIRQRSKIYMAA